MWSGWMNRFVAGAAKAEPSRVDHRGARVYDAELEDAAEIDRETPADDGEPGESRPVRL